MALTRLVADLWPPCLVRLGVIRGGARQGARPRHGAISAPQVQEALTRLPHLPP
jgi:hypothetical protein